MCVIINNIEHWTFTSLAFQSSCSDMEAVMAKEYTRALLLWRRLRSWTRLWRKATCYCLNSMELEFPLSQMHSILYQQQTIKMHVGTPVLHQTSKKQANSWFNIMIFIHFTNPNVSLITRLFWLVKDCIYIYNPNCSDHQTILLVRIYCIYNPNCSDHQAILMVRVYCIYIYIYIYIYYIIPTALITKVFWLGMVYCIYI